MMMASRMKLGKVHGSPRMLKMMAMMLKTKAAVHAQPLPVQRPHARPPLSNAKTIDATPTKAATTLRKDAFHNSGETLSPQENNA